MVVDWDEYGTYIHERVGSTGGNLFWYIGKNNDHIEDHLWALDLISNNIDETKIEIDVRITEDSQPDQNNTTATMEKSGRALVLSKFLGLLKVIGGNSYELTLAYEKLVEQGNPTTMDEIRQNDSFFQTLTDQFEKFYYFQSPIFKDNENTQASKTIFKIYPIFFVYEVLVLLKKKYKLESMLTKDECKYFLFLAYEQQQAAAVAEKISEYRNSGEQESIITNIKPTENGALDSRVFNCFELCKYFDFQRNQSISVNEENFKIIESKVSKFKELIGKGDLIQWNSDSPEQFLELLYSKKDLLDYHYSYLLRKANS
jgi:hypothetical protein